jgi:hypothetical protein
MVSAKPSLHPDGVGRYRGKTDQQSEEHENKAKRRDQPKNQAHRFDLDLLGHDLSRHNKPLLTQTRCREQAFSGGGQPIRRDDV